jgi:pantetheine-phosphate adenylyltransferase
VKEIALFGGNIAPFVSVEVREQVEARVAERGRLGSL